MVQQWAHQGPSTGRFWYVAIHFWWLVLGGCKPNWEAEGPNKRHGNNVLRVKEHTEVMIGCKTSIIYLLLLQLTLLFINQLDCRTSKSLRHSKTTSANRRLFSGVFDLRGNLG